MLSSSSSSSERPLIACIAIFSIACGLAFNTASIIIAAQNTDHPCQGHDKTGITLAAWLLITGIVGLAVIVCYALTFIGFLAMDSAGCGVFGVILILLSALFNLAWFVVGIVIVARSHHDCVDQSTDLGVMAVIMLVLDGLAICSSRGSMTTMQAN